MRGLKERHAPMVRASGDKCPHYWVIDSATGPTSRGVCKRCGAVKEFFNSLDAMVANREAIFELPELANVEVDKGERGS